GRQVTAAPHLVQAREAGRRRRPASRLHAAAPSPPASRSLARSRSHAVAVVVIATLVVAACGGGRPTPTPAPTSDATTSGSASPMPTPEPSPEVALTPVRVQLRWTLGAAFAGYVAAIDQGYFESAGLEVILIEGGPEVAAEASGSARDGPEFTISWVPRVLAARAAGTSDLVDIGQVFRRSSTLTMSFREAEI